MEHECTWCGKYASRLFCSNVCRQLTDLCEKHRISEGMNTCDKPFEDDLEILCQEIAREAVQDASATPSAKQPDTSKSLTIAQELRQRREHMGLSKSELARRLGTKHPTIITWEKPGYQGYTLSKLTRTFAALGAELRLVVTDKLPRGVTAISRSHTVVTTAATSDWRLR